MGGGLIPEIGAVMQDTRTTGTAMELVGPKQSLAELTAQINAGHREILERASDLLERVIHEGFLLIEARRRILAEGSRWERGGQGHWEQWVEDNCEACLSDVQYYVRAAWYHETLRAQDGFASFASIQRALRGLPGPFPRGKQPPSKEVVAAVKDLRDAGKTWTEIAEQLGVRSPSTVKRWTDPRLQEDNRRRAAEWTRAKVALREQKRKRAEKAAARKAGGGISEAYALAERMQDVLGQAHGEATDREARAALSRAGEHYRKMRDEIVRALGVTS